MPALYHPDGRRRVVPDHSEKAYKAAGWQERSPASAGRGAPQPPDETALKAGWVDYAVSQGMARETAEAMTKAELKERFGA